MSLAQLRAKMAAKKAASTKVKTPEPAAPTTPLTAVAKAVVETKAEGQLNKDEVTLAHLNDEQLMAVKLAKLNKSFCLIGGAGSGKTTTTRSIATTLWEQGLIGKMTGSTEKLFNVGAPSVAVLSFTNQAVRNIASALPQDFKGQCSTMHNAVEYHPDEFEIEVLDDHGNWTGDMRKSMRFIPRYGIEGSRVEAYQSVTGADDMTAEDWELKHGSGLGLGEKLPHIDYVIVEEAGNVPRDLFYVFVSALPNFKNTTFIFLGDLNQLPPVFDDAILGFMLLALPVIELKTLYRNVGLVTKTAQRLLTGKPIRDKEALEELSGTDESGTVLFKNFKKHVDWEIATASVGKVLKNMVVDGSWSVDDGVVLLPQNVKLGQELINKWIGQGVAERHNLDVHHVTYNGVHNYFCIGDRVLFQKRYRRITKIEPNLSYKGKKPLPPSKHVNRWGTIAREHEADLLGGKTRAQYDSEIDIDKFLDSYSGEELTTGQQASSIITMVLDSSELDDLELKVVERNPAHTFGEIVAKSAGDVGNILPVNAMTVYKAQGSEWKNVLLILHRSHGGMLTREMLYTGMTRARQNLTVWYSGEDSRTPGASALCRGVLNQALKGRTLDEKLDYFRDKLKVEAVRSELAAKKKAEANEY